MSRKHLSLAGAMFALACTAMFAGLDGSYVLPVEHDAIRYSKGTVRDRISALQKSITNGDLSLKYDPTSGYLESVLKALDIPLSSQVLVFSKTSFQASLISPHTPRALYFNDDVSVGYVRGGEVLEVAAADPERGIIFYTLDQEDRTKPQFARQDQCLQCHASGSTLGVPGLLVRSVYPDRRGLPVFQAGSFITDHRSPFKERWGGWYVTGTHGDQVHMGNTSMESEDKPDTFVPSRGSNVTDLSKRFNTDAFLTPHSDIVALLVLEHQTRMQNLLTRVGFEARMALADQDAMNSALGEPKGNMRESTVRRIRLAADELVTYMLFADEDLLTHPVQGTSGFQDEYPKRGPRDQKGRSLRDLDLKTRLLRYPCSPLIYSEAFEALPDAARERIYERLSEVLSGKDTSPAFAKITAADRQAVSEILLDTKPAFASYFKTASD
jgi:hypothetical protein